MSRRAITFDCQGAALCGIVDMPEHTIKSGIGVLIVTGGPQYRVGSHRQFVQLAGDLAASGYACMRFDERGAGDSDGETVSFDARDDDIRSAIDAFFATVSALRGVVIWGLCDAASAALIYAHSDERVKGLILLNPWVRREQSQAQTQVKVYYRSRLLDRQFWGRLLRGQVKVFASVAELLRSVATASRKQQTDRADFVDRMLHGAKQFSGPVMLILSGQDLTAREFVGISQTGDWQQWLQRKQVEQVELQDANHTFSRRVWKNAVSDKTRAWLPRLSDASVDP